MGQPTLALLDDRFWSHVRKGTESECWVWTGATYHGGYGSFRRRGKHYVAHRAAYEGLIGPIPDGLTLDHLCRNTACVNPDHLEPVTNRENILRGTSPSARAARATHCPKGHPYDLFNTEISKTTGGRLCRICRSAASSRQWAAEKAMREAVHV